MDASLRRSSVFTAVALALLACGGETASDVEATPGGDAGTTSGGGGKPSTGGGAGTAGKLGSGAAGAAPVVGGNAGAAGSATGTAGAAGVGQGGAAAGAAGLAGQGPGGSGVGGAGVAGAGGSGTAGAGGKAAGGTNAGSAGKAGSGSAGAPPAPIDGPNLKICSFNIRVGTAADGKDAWDNRKGQVFAIMQKTDAHFIGVQEDLGFQLKEIDAKIPAYDRIGVGVQADGGGEHVALYYLKGAFELGKHGTFWLSETPNKPGSISWGNDGLPRAVTWGRFKEKSSGYGFYVYNTHFDHRANPSRGKGALLVSQHMKDRDHPEEPVIFMGDLNMQDDAPPFRYLEGKAELEGKANPVPLLDTFRALHPNEKNARTAHGFGGGVVGSPIDFIMLSKEDGTVKQAWINHDNENGAYPSDHYPIFATMKLVDKK